MREMEYLTEKDLEYFEKKEKRGEAVILRLNPKTLLELDLSAIKAPETLDEKEIKKWLDENKLFMEEVCEETEKLQAENEQLRRELWGTRTDNQSVKRNKGETLAHRLLQVSLDAEQKEVIEYAINNGLTEQQILSLLRDDFSAAEMRAVCDIFLNE